MKKQLFGIAAAIGVASLISIFSARRIEAQYSSPVKVVNTTSAPAIASIMDDPGRIPYQATSTGPCPSASGLHCEFNFPAVPAGHRLVVQQVAVELVYNGTPQSLAAEVLSETGAILGGLVPPITPFFTTYSQPVKAVVDGGHSLSVRAFTSVALFQSGQVTVSGYLLDCAAAPCAPFAP